MVTRSRTGVEEEGAPICRWRIGSVRVDVMPTEAGYSLPDLRAYLGDGFRRLTRSESFLEAIPGHPSPDAASQKRLPIVLGRIRQLAELV